MARAGQPWQHHQTGTIVLTHLTKNFFCQTFFILSIIIMTIKGRLSGVAHNPDTSAPSSSSSSCAAAGAWASAPGAWASSSSYSSSWQSRVGCHASPIIRTHQPRPARTHRQSGPAVFPLSNIYCWSNIHTIWSNIHTIWSNFHTIWSNIYYLKSIA